MYTSNQLQLLRNAAKGVVIPGIDTTDGNLLPARSLTTLSAIIAYGASAGLSYNAAANMIYVTKAGTVLNGCDFGSATVYVNAPNVTIQNCKFTSTSGWYAIQATSAASNLTVTHDTFDGGGQFLKLAAWITTPQSVTITSNTFLKTPGDGVDAFGGGLISGNYFSGAGYASNGQHPDAIWISNSTNPMTISNNFIDWTAPGPNFVVNNCVRITDELGPVSNVTVTGNYLMGGSACVQAVQGARPGALSNVSIINNYIGFGQYYSFYPGSTDGIVETGNVIYDWTNPAWSANAWTAYAAAGLPTPYLLTSVDGAAINPSASPGPTTIYGGGTSGLLIYGGDREMNFVGGFGYQNFWVGQGANIFTYLTVSDGGDSITGFNPAKDVIDLSHVASNAAAMLGLPQNLTFIGTAAFDGAGAEVRYQQNANGTTSVQLALAGDKTADMQINIAGHLTLTGANFALTDAQSQADMAAGAALSETAAPSTGWPLYECQYTNVQGHAYSSFASILSGNYLVINDLNFSATSGEIDLFGPANQPDTALTIAKGGGGETVSSQGKTVSLTFHQTETIEAGNAQAPETFAFSSGWGNETINGFATSGANADYLQLSASAFSYLTPDMTQDQELAAVLLNASGGANSTTIADSHGDSLTLNGITVAMLNANPGLVKFV